MSIQLPDVSDVKYTRLTTTHPPPSHSRTRRIAFALIAILATVLFAILGVHQAPAISKSPVLSALYDSLHPQQNPLWQWGNISFANVTEEQSRWHGLLSSLYNTDGLEPEAGCPQEQYIIRDLNAIASYRDLALHVNTPDRSVSTEPEAILDALGIQIVVLTVQGYTQRQDRLRAALAKEGITHFYWQLGWDVSIIGQHADAVRKVGASGIDDASIKTPLVSLAMKQVNTAIDWGKGQPHQGSYYVPGHLPASRNQTASVTIPRRNPSAASQAQHLLIMEDDATLVPDFVRRLQQLILGLSGSYSSITIGACCDQHASLDVDSETVEQIGPFRFHYTMHDAARLRSWAWVRCMGAYLINVDSAQQLTGYFERLASNSTSILPGDFLMNEIFSWSRQDAKDGLSHLDSYFWSEPPLVYQGTKTIHDNGGRMHSSLRWSEFKDDIES